MLKETKLNDHACTLKLCDGVKAANNQLNELDKVRSMNADIEREQTKQLEHL